MSNTQTLELDMLKENFGNDPETFVQIMDIFLQEIPEDVALLKTKFESKQIKNIGLVAHKIKSSYRLLGMEVETLLLQELETGAKNAMPLADLKVIYSQFMENYDYGIQLVTNTRDSYTS